MRPHPILVASLFASACGGGADDVSETTVTDSAGVAIVTSAPADHPLDWTFTTAMQLGGADSGPASFTSARHRTVATNDRDRIFVFDRDASAVAVFGDDGTPVATMGGKGSGPGEIEFAFELVDAGEGVVALYDFSKRMLLRWDESGTLLGEGPVPALLEGGSLVAVRGDTTLLLTRDADSVRTVSMIQRVTRHDTVTLATLRTPPVAMVAFSCFAAMIPPLFTPTLVFATQGGWLAVARQDRYQIDLFRDGTLVRSIRRAIDGAPTTLADIDRQNPQGMRVEFGAGRASCTVPSTEIRERQGMADRLPVIQDLAFGPDGTLWVQRHTFPGDTPDVDVFAADGGYLGTEAGHGVPLGILSGGRVLFPVADSSTGVIVVGVFTVGRRAHP